MGRRIVAAALAGVLTLGVVGVAAARRGPDPHRATYVLKEDLYGYPGRLRLIHCDPNPDRMVRLHMVRYIPSTGTIVYRCVSN